MMMYCFVMIAGIDISSIHEAGMGIPFGEPIQGMGFIDTIFMYKQTLR